MTTFYGLSMLGLFVATAIFFLYGKFAKKPNKFFNNNKKTKQNEQQVQIAHLKI
jgi:hypothetical protein